LPRSAGPAPSSAAGRYGEPIRLGVIDIGSNTVHLLVVDAYPGAHPLPSSTHKVALRLSEGMAPDGSVSAEQVHRLVEFVGDCVKLSDDQGVEDVVSFATSALREAPNGQDVIDRIVRETGVVLQVLSGRDEARLTFLAVRRWFGWSSGRLLVLDIGGGSLELASGLDEEPDVAISVSLGAGRVTRDHLDGDPPSPDSVAGARRHVRTVLARELRPLRVGASPDRVVGTICPWALREGIILRRLDHLS
jgi:exopolyphosphatase/guanosine-5'-triphosphate,3'-diphosphate pyrophosphatase